MLLQLLQEIQLKNFKFFFDITGNDLTDVATAINAADLDITATLEDSNTTLKLVSDFGYDIELSNVEIEGINKAQDIQLLFSLFNQ